MRATRTLFIRHGAEKTPEGRSLRLLRHWLSPAQRAQFAFGDVMLAQKIARETCEGRALAVARKFTSSGFLFSRARPLR
jgi:hypothetical protein